MKNSGIQIQMEKKNQLQNRLRKMKKIVLVLNHKIIPKNNLISNLPKMKSNNLVIAVMTNMTAQAISKFLHSKAEKHNTNFTMKS